MAFNQFSLDLAIDEILIAKHQLHCIIASTPTVNSQSWAGSGQHQKGQHLEHHTACHHPVALLLYAIHSLRFYTTNHL